MKIGLVIGCARSGTSILGELIAAHEHVKYIYEAHEVWEIGGLGIGESHRLTAEHATPDVVAAIRGKFEEQFDGRMIVEKCPRNSLRVPYIHRIFPEAKIINIIRDGRDVTCSLRPGIGAAEWRHLKPENWKELFQLPGLERCARVWKEVVTIAEEDLKNMDHLDVRYEALVRDPKPLAARVLGHLGLPPSDSVNAFCQRIQDQTEGSYMADNYSRRWNTIDHERRVGRWRENLNPDEQRMVEEVLSETLARFGYAS